MQIDITNDYRINKALGVAAEVAVAVGEAAMVALFILLDLLGIENVSLRGLVWTATGLFVAATVAVSWIL